MRCNKTGSRPLSFKLILTISAFFAAICSEAQQIVPDYLRVADLFGDHMVVQQGMQVPVWGFARPGAQVSVVFAGTTKETTADREGKWMVYLPALESGGPYEMRIQCGNTRRQFRDVMAGEVWLASGQSNMAFTMSKTLNADSDIAAADYTGIRLFSAAYAIKIHPADTLATASSWQYCTPGTVKDFAAAAYYFARDLHLSREVPVGIISASKGSTRAEAWMSAETLLTLPAFREKVRKQLSSWNEKSWEVYVNESRTLEQQRPAIVKQAAEGIKAGVHLPDYRDEQWDTVTSPVTMRKIGKPAYWGFVWMRTKLQIPAATDSIAQIELAIQADGLQVYLNGALLKAKQSGDVYRCVIPEGVIKTGENTLAIRILTYRGRAVVDKAAGRLVINKNAVIPITGAWKYNTSIEPRLAQTQTYYTAPTVLYNGMINPLVPYGIKGVIWYQGEGNADKPEEYKTLFTALVQNWRDRFRQDSLPFIYVQLASMKRPGEDGSYKWALLRDAQFQSLDIPFTAMVSAVDLGEENDLHPRNKADVGKRLALAARSIAYGEELVYTGPLFRSVKFTSSSAQISFTGTGSGLISKDASVLKGFSIAGNDKKFYKATAVIENDQVKVSAPEVKEPRAVRYAFESWPDGNLYNKEGLPASPFRTDNW